MRRLLRSLALRTREHVFQDLDALGAVFIANGAADAEHVRECAKAVFRWWP